MSRWIRRKKKKTHAVYRMKLCVYDWRYDSRWKWYSSMFFTACTLPIHVFCILEYNTTLQAIYRKANIWLILKFHVIEYIPHFTHACTHQTDCSAMFGNYNKIHSCAFSACTCCEYSHLYNILLWLCGCLFAPIYMMILVYVQIEMSWNIFIRNVVVGGRYRIEFRARSTLCAL